MFFLGLQSVKNFRPGIPRISNSWSAETIMILQASWRREEPWGKY